MKRPIDQKRDGAGSFTLGGKEGESIDEMLVIDHQMVIVSTHAVYQSQMADQVDPGRTDINLPQIIQREILPYGSAEPFVRQSLLMAKALFDTHHLGPNFNKARAMSLALKAAHDFAAMADLKRSLNTDQDAGIAELGRAVKGNQLKLPTTPNLASRIGTYLGHARGACLSLISIIELFYPKAKQNEPWRANLERGLAAYLEKNEASQEPFRFAAHVMELANNARNAFEHPDATKSVTVTDFAVVPGGKYQKPRLKVMFESKKLAEADVDYVTDTILENLASVFEGLCAMMCDANIQPFGPIETRVGEQPQQITHKSSRYAYQSWFKEGTVLPGQ